MVSDEGDTVIDVTPLPTDTVCEALEYQTQDAPVPSEPPNTVRVTELAFGVPGAQIGRLPEILIIDAAVDCTQSRHAVEDVLHWPEAQVIPFGVVHWPLLLQTW